MVQAARSGKQNIAEGSMASATSKSTEIKLINVAKASLEELMIDYEDFLRTKKLSIWDKNHPYCLRLREINRTIPNSTYETFKKAIEHEDPAICANAMITLIQITTYLLRKLIIQLEQAFIETGGLNEKMAAVRAERRRNN